MNRRAFFGALAGTAALAAAPANTGEHQVCGWRIEWSGWREPVNQFVKIGFWIARRDPMPDSLPWEEYPCFYSTTLGVVEGCRDLYVLDMTRADRNAPILPTEPAIKFDAAKAWARQRLVETLEAL